MQRAIGFRDFTSELSSACSPGPRRWAWHSRWNKGVVAQLPRSHSGRAGLYDFFVAASPRSARAERGRSGGLADHQPCQRRGRVHVTGFAPPPSGGAIPGRHGADCRRRCRSEEIPEGVTAVLTSGRSDLYRMCGAGTQRARLFATCYERATYERLKGLKEKVITLSVTPAETLETAEGRIDK